ncbi:MAG: response regulator transcription factor [Bacteroidota bacterium]
MFNELLKESYKNPARDDLEIVENVDINSVHYDVGKDFFQVNKRAELAGFSMGEIHNINCVYDLIHPADVEKVFSWTDKAVKFISNNKIASAGISSQLVFRMIGKHRKIYYVNRYAIINRLDKNGIMATNASIFHDVTWMKPNNIGAGKLNGPGTEFFDYDIPELESFKCDLSNREIEVLNLISKGFSSEIISHSLHISVHTVNTHRKNMLRKMEASNTPQMLYIARELGLI